MPYSLKGDCVVKTDTGETVPGGCHKNHAEAVAHLRALEANVKDSAVAVFSMSITKARFNGNEVNPNRRMQWRSVNSDVDSDLYEESMSTELFYDFTHRINDKIPVPEPFEEVVCEGDWCGGMPYLSIAHYKSGTGKINVPGIVDSVYVEGEKLKSRGYCDDSDLGKAVFNALKEDIVQKKSGNQEHKPVRISIGFLDLEHEHVAKTGGQNFTFTRSDVGQICPLCAQGIGGKIYKKGQLIHLALTRVPVNPRTEMVAEGVEEKSMDEITTKKQDAESIIGDLAEGLEEKSIADDVLVVRSDAPVADPSPIQKCYDPNDGGWNADCIAATFDKFMADVRNTIGTTIKSMLDKSDIVEETMEENTVEKGVMGIPEKPFNYAGLDGNGNNTVSNPVKADSKDEEAGEGDKMGDESKEHEKMHKEMSTLDKSFADLKSVLESAKSVEEVQAAFNALGTEVEKSYTPPAPSTTDIAAIVKSAVEAAVAPLKMEIATLKSANVAPVQNGVVQSKALNINPMNPVASFSSPDQLLQKALSQAGQQSTRKLSQIEMIARKSTGLQS